jgi:hypothetical protein
MMITIKDEDDQMSYAALHLAISPTHSQLLLSIITNYEFHQLSAALIISDRKIKRIKKANNKNWVCLSFTATSTINKTA